MADHIVTAHWGHSGMPHLVASEPSQYCGLVELILRDPGYTGIAARNHTHGYLYVDNRPILPGDRISTRRWMETGCFARLGGVLFVDETTPEGQDWAWLALRPRMLHSTPAVYYDQDTQTQFPPACAMPTDELQPIVVEWLTTGQRPACVEWLTVNTFNWKLDGAGDLAPSPDMA